MDRHQAEASQEASPETTRGLLPSGGRTFRWHLYAFLGANGALSLMNAYTGRPWWAFWPLVVTSFVLAVHYLIYKATAINESWVDTRVQELNLKSYDRGHIEDLKARLGGKVLPQDRQDGSKHRNSG